MIPLDSPQSDPIAGDFQSDAWNKLSDWEVIQRLSSQGSMAEAVLRRRGYRDRDLAIARQAADIDPSVRLNLVRQLPRVNGIDARLWLEQLAEDEDREVRQTAAAILRTANSSR